MFNVIILTEVILFCLHRPKFIFAWKFLDLIPYELCDLLLMPFRVSNYIKLLSWTLFIWQQKFLKRSVIYWGKKNPSVQHELASSFHGSSVCAHTPQKLLTLPYVVISSLPHITCQRWHRDNHPDKVKANCGRGHGRQASFHENILSFATLETQCPTQEFEGSEG